MNREPIVKYKVYRTGLTKRPPNEDYTFEEFLKELFEDTKVSKTDPMAVPSTGTVKQDDR